MDTNQHHAIIIRSQELEVIAMSLPRFSVVGLADEERVCVTICSVPGA